MARPKKNRPPDLIIVLDFGGSLTKVIYMDKSGLPKPLCMEPEVIGVPKTSIENYERKKLGNSDFADSAWVGVGESYYAVGYLAASQFNGNAGLNQLKYERAYPKTLAAVWAVAQELGLKNKFSAAIAVLLPPGEYENAAGLERLIRRGLAAYETPTGVLNVSLEHFECKPEGGGVYLIHEFNNSAVLKRKTWAVVMVGYRNASVLVTARGQVNKRVTSNLGFVKLVEAVRDRTSGLALNRLAEAIALAGEQPNLKVLQPLLMSVTESGRRDELIELRSAIIECRLEYALSLKSWLREVLPRELDEVVLSGGTAQYLESELKDHFSGVTVNWNASIELPESLLSAELGNRLSDAYGMYQYFLNLLSQSLDMTTLSSPSNSVCLTEEVAGVAHG